MFSQKKKNSNPVGRVQIKRNGANIDKMHATWFIKAPEFNSKLSLQIHSLRKIRREQLSNETSSTS